MLSVIIPALNAAATIRKSLDSVNGGAAAPPREMIVVDSGSVDDTQRIAEDAGAIVVQAQRGRGFQLAAGAREAAGDWLLFLHADTYLEDGWRRSASAFMSSTANRERAAYFRFALDDTARAARRLEAAVLLRNRCFGLPYGDQGLLVHRGLYDATGGYRHIELMEDVDLVRRIGRRSLVMLDTKAVTSAVRYRRDGYLSRPVRNLFCLGLYALGVPSRYINHLYR